MSKKPRKKKGKPRLIVCRSGRVLTAANYRAIYNAVFRQRCAYWDGVGMEPAPRYAIPED